jgi:hypothetical protein
MGAKAKVKIDKDLVVRAKAVAETAGYSSVEEFLTHVIERELSRLEGAKREARDEKDLRDRLKGLGYIS